MSSSNSIPVGDTITDGVSIVYVSSNGDDANSGLNSAEPKLTIAAALTTAYGFPSLGRRVVKCIDASVFTENVAVSQIVDIEMPHARIIGTLGAASNLGRMSFDVAAVQGNVTVRAFSHYTFEQVNGDLIIENCTLGDSYVHAEDWVSGNVVTTNAAGVVTFNIVHNDANLDIPTNISGFTPKGLVDGEPVNPSEYARSLETLTGDLRLQSSAVHYPDGAQVVYVSNNGSNSNSGLSVHEAVQTLNQALSVAAGLPTTARRIIACLDGSHFTENFSSANDIDLFLPIATITGNIGGSTGNKTFVRIGTLKGDLTMGTQDTVEIDELQGDISYPSGSHTSYLKIHHFLSGSSTFDSAATGYCHIEIDMPRNATMGAWPSGMYIFGHIGENTYTSGTSLVNELSKLSGAERLDASAIKNLPSGGGSHPQVEANINVNGQWIDLYQWSNTDSEYSDNVILKAVRSDGSLLFQSYVYAAGSRRDRHNPDAHVLSVYNRISNYLTDETAIYRVIFDDDTEDSIVRLQFTTTLDDLMKVVVTDCSPIPPTSSETLGPLTAYSGTPALIIDSVDVSKWQANNIHQSHSGGVLVDNIGDATVKQAWTRYSNQVVEHLASNQVVQSIGESGTRFSAGEYGAWETPSSSTPFQAIGNFPSLSVSGRTNPNDASLNPFGDVTMEGSDQSTNTGTPASNINWANYSLPGGVTQRMLNWNTVDGNSILRIRFTGAGVTFGANVRFTASFRGFADLNDEDETWDIRVGSPTGQIIATWVMPAATNDWLDFSVEHPVSSLQGSANQVDLYIIQTAGPAQTTTRSGLGRYSMGIVSKEPALQSNVVAQFDSNYRGVLLPRITPNTSAQHSQGVVALNGLDNGNLVIYNGNSWSKLEKHTNLVTANSHSYTYSAELSLAGLQSGWEIQNAVLGTDYRVEPIGGFPAMAHFLNTTGWAYIKPTIQNEDQFWADARANGLVCKTRFKYVSGSSNAVIEINAGTAQGFGGAYRTFFTNASPSTINVEWVTSTTDLNVRDSVTLNKGELYDLQILIPPGEDVYHVIINGVRVGTGVQCSAYTGRIIRTYIAGDSNRNIQIQSHGFYVMAANAASRQITQQEIDNDSRIIVPETAKTSEILLPKGLQAFDKTIQIENGSAQIINVRASGGDTQLIGGQTTYSINPYSSVRIRQTDLPFGNQWAASDSQPKTIDSRGQSLFLHCDSSGNIVNRHGTFNGDVTVTSPTTGNYDINVGGHIFTSTNFSATATVYASTTNQHRFNATVSLGAIGEVGVHIVNHSGGHRANAFCLALHW